VEEFQAVMQDRGLRRDGRVRLDYPSAARADAGTLALTLRALGAGRARRYYEIRIEAIPGMVAATV
jgi:hypothetical protein